MFIALFFWLLFAIFSAVIASNKGRSGFAWFLIGFFFGPFGLLVAVLPAQQKQTQEAKEVEATSQKREFNPDLVVKKCPSCAERIKLEALVCRLCGHAVEPEDVQAGIQWASKDFEERFTFTPDEKEKLSRGLCPNCDAYQAFKRDTSKNRLTCEVCKSQYPLDGEERAQTEPESQRMLEEYTKESEDLVENDLSLNSGGQKHSLWVSASNAIHDKDFDLAISLATKALSTPGSLTDQHFAYNGLIEASVKKKDYEAAKQYCLAELEDFAEIGNALRKDFDGELPATIPCRDTLLDIVVDVENDYDEAERLINVFVQKGLITQEEAEGELEGIKVPRLYTMAEEMLTQGNFQKAKSIFGEIITMDKSEAPEIYKMMGNHSLENKMKYEALQYFQKAIAADPQIVGVKRKLNTLSKELGAEVESNEKEVLKTQQNNEKLANEWWAKRDLGNEFVKMKQYDRAWKLFNEALVLRSKEGMPCDTIYPDMAKMREKGKGYKDALLLYLLAFKEGLRMDEREPARYVSQGIDRCVKKLGIKNVTHSQLYELVKERPKLDAMRTVIDELVSDK